MKKLFYLMFTLGLTTTLNAQKAPKYDKIYYKPVHFENEVVKVEIDNIVSLPKETKFRMSITN